MDTDKLQIYVDCFQLHKLLYKAQFEMCKRRNAYAISRNLIDKIDPSWLKFISFDFEHMKAVANEGYTHNELLARNYNLKLKGHGITV